METVTSSDHPDIDGGWAWVVVGALFVYNLLVGGTYKSFGLLFVEFNHIFPDDGPARVGLIGLTFGLCSLFMAPLGGRLSDSVPVRVMALVGGVILSTSLSCTALARHLGVVVFTFGMVGGIVGLLDGPVLASIGYYFRRKRSMASGIAWTGSSVGNLVLAPLLSFLISYYGIRGTLILMGGLWLHLCVIGLLLRPLPKVRELEVEVKVESRRQSQVHVQCQCQRQGRKGSLLQSQDHCKAECQCQYDGQCQQRSSLENGRPGKVTELVLESVKVTKTYNSNKDLTSMGTGQGETAHAITMQNSIPDTLENKVHSNPDICTKTLAYQKGSIVTPSNANLKPINATEGDEDLQSELLLSTIIAHDAQKSNSYLSFLKNPPMWGLLMTMGCGFFGYYMPFVAIPLWAEETGLHRKSVALVISVVGLVEIVSRVVLGVVIDMFHLRVTVVLTVSYVIVGLAGQLVVLVPGFWSLIGYACVHGLLGGVVHVVMATCLAGCVPVDRTGSVMGLVVMELSITSACTTAIAGVVKELTGSYKHVMQLSSGVYLVAAALYTVIPLIIRIFNRIHVPAKRTS